MDVMPVARNGDGENENDDYDEADILEPLVWRGRFAGLSPLCAGR
jgi:hypothetical protein